MHYYTFNIGDYVNNTKHLDLMEDLAYRRLLDHYYDTEKPLNLDLKRLSRLICMPHEQEIVKNVLDEFFEKTDLGYVQKRVQLEIEKYHSKAYTARANGQKGGRPKKTQKKPNPNPEKTHWVNLANPDLTQSKPDSNPEKSGSKANQETITKKHKTTNNNQETQNNNQETQNKNQEITNTSTSHEVDMCVNQNQTQQVFQYWVDVMNKSTRTKLDKKRESKIKQALKQGYTVDQLKNAVMGCTASDYHMGVNDQNKLYNDLVTILRDSPAIDSHIERFEQKTNQSNAMPSNDPFGLTDNLNAVAQRYAPKQTNQGERYDAHDLG